MVRTPPPRVELETTRWSVVLDARGFDDSAARAALAELVAAYWQPLYAFARRRGHPSEDARDLVQGFFAHLLEKDGLAGVRRGRGRFRSYLLGAFKHHLGHERDRARAAKRGGGQAALDLDEAEDLYGLEARTEASPDRLYERRWALTVLDRVLKRLRREWTSAGRGEAFDVLKGFLTGDDALSQRQAASGLGMSDGALRAAVHRLRQRFGLLLRHEIAATVTRPEEVEDELRHLLEALGSA